MEIKLKSVCYAVCCCNGDLDHYFFWLCPTVYEFCAKYVYREVQEQTEEDVMSSSKV